MIISVSVPYVPGALAPRHSLGAFMFAHFLVAVIMLVCMKMLHDCVKMAETAAARRGTILIGLTLMSITCWFGIWASPLRGGPDEAFITAFITPAMMMSIGALGYAAALIAHVICTRVVRVNN